MAASVVDPGSFGHREMTALLNWQKFLIDKTAAIALGRYFLNSNFYFSTLTTVVSRQHFNFLTL